MTFPQQIEFGLDGVSPYRVEKGRLRRSVALPSWAIRNPQSAIRNSSGIALVITLLMLSAITFLAVALLVLTRSQRESATASLDVGTAKAMSEAALARAQSQMIAHMKAHGDLFNFDYTVSRNFINSNGFVPGVSNIGNVNYDFYTNGFGQQQSMNPTVAGGAYWAQNIANLFLDPRAPVFIKVGTNTDFRSYIDLDQNGIFEPSGLMPVLGPDGAPIVNGLGGYVSNFFNGEPEWIGVLQYPDVPHSATNRFIGRYAFIVLPMGKMLDYNFIHDYLLGGATGPMPPPGLAPADRYMRDQGVGPWELNLAGLLYGNDTNLYQGQYSYQAPANINQGAAFSDAYSFLYYRYNGNYGFPFPMSFSNTFGPNMASLGSIDALGSPLTAIRPTTPWPGSYSSNNFYDMGDVFDPYKTSPNFARNLMTEGTMSSSYRRYMFLRLLASIGAGSVPELQTYVYGDVVTSDPSTQPTVLRTKVNLNWDNSYQIANNLNTSPTTLVPWTQEPGGAVAFFTNAAESLLRSQNFRITNGYDINNNPIISYIHFGVTNIPIYNSTNPSIRYTEQIHRMLQLAANIYDASRSNNYALGSGGVTTVLPYPSVFRPIFYTTLTNGAYAVYIGGYVSVTNDASDRIQSLLPPPGLNLPPALKFPWDQSITANDNVWGIPWVIGAVKGLPAFDRFVADTSWMVTRKLLFKRHPLATTGRGTNFGNPNLPPQYTNQFFIMSITNNFGMDAWNAYAENLNVPFKIVATTFVSIGLSNGAGFSMPPTNYTITTDYSSPSNFWRGFGTRANPAMSDGMISLLTSNVASLQSAYFSETTGAGLIPVYASTNTNASGFGFNLGRFLPSDLQQTNWPVYNWVLTVSNCVVYAMLDTVTGKAYDFVNLGPFGTTYILTNLIYSGTSAGSIPVQGGGVPATGGSYWDPAPNNPNFPSVGLLNQISNGIQKDPYFAAEIAGSASNGTRLNSNLYFSCSNDVAATYPVPPTVTSWAQTLLVNDPLVHYTVGDLTRPSGDGSQILTDNKRYEPWPLNTTEQQFSGFNMTLKDPLILSSDDWNFPAGLFPSVGWLGRVHRGTPWQTVFLKADPAPTVNGVNQNQQAWTANWVSTLDTYPTNDYALLDLFTAAPNDNAARGLLSVNQTNDGPWYALLSGVAVNTTPPPPGHSVYPLGYTNYTVIDAPTIAPLLYGTNVIGTDGNGNPINTYIAGINAIRSAQQPDPGVFRKTGNVFNSPMLTINSPYLLSNAPISPTGYFKDEQVEAIPQQVAGLLKIGQPQFVIYCYGQALKPKDIYFGGPPNFNLCTNYQITGEYLTRAVCHVVGDPAAANVKFQVDSINIIPAD